MDKTYDAALKAHKEAGKRAASYLEQTYGLKLPVTAQLQLVARVMNMANWETLHGMTKQGRAPKIDYGSTQEHGTASTMTVPLTDTRFPQPRSPSTRDMAIALQQYSSIVGWTDEHPEYTKAWYAALCLTGEPNGTYWERVVAEISNAEQPPVWPWEMAGMNEVAVCVHFGIDVKWDVAEKCYALSMSPVPTSYNSHGSRIESVVWMNAYQHLMNAFMAGQQNQAVDYVEWNKLTAEAKVALLRKFFFTQQSKLEPGEMKVDDRLSNPDAVLCQALGIQMQYFSEDSNEYPGRIRARWYTDMDGELYLTEKEAWEAEAKALAQQAFQEYAHELTRRKWDNLPMYRKVALLRPIV